LIVFFKTLKDQYQSVGTNIKKVMKVQD